MKERRLNCNCNRIRGKSRG